MTKKTPIYQLGNHKAAIALLVVTIIISVASIIYGITQIINRSPNAIKYILGSIGLFSLTLGSIYYLLYRVSITRFFSDSIEIKTLIKTKTIVINKIQDITFSDREVEFKSLGTHSPAIIINHKDGKSDIIWCAQKRKLIEGKILVDKLSIQDGKLVLNKLHKTLK